MAITAQISKQPKSSVKLDITVGAAEVKAAFDRTYQQLAKKARIDGFRPGKVPTSVLKMKFGQSIAADVLDELLNEAFREAAREHQLKPIGRGELLGELGELAEDKDYAFSMAVDVYPEIEVPEYQGVEVKKAVYEIKDKDVDHELEHLRERFARLEEAADGVVAKDSLVSIDFDVELDGEKVEGLSRTGYSYDNAVGAAYPDLKKDLTGKKLGETFAVKSSLPKEFPDKEKAGKTCHFRVTVNKVEKRVLPEIDDELAQKVSSAKTVAELRTQMKENMENAARTKEQRQVQGDIVDHLVKKSKIDLPESMVRAELEAMVAELKNTLMYSRVTLEDYLARQNKTEEQLFAEFREPAEHQVRAVLLLNEIARKENIDAAAAEVDEEVRRMAERYGHSFEDTKKYLLENGEIDSLAFSLRKKKTLAFLVERAKVKEGKSLSYADLHQH